MIRIVLSFLCAFIYASLMFLKSVCLFVSKYVSYYLMKLVTPKELNKLLFQELLLSAKVSPPAKHNDLLFLKQMEVKLFSGLENNSSGLHQGKLLEGMLETLFFCSTNERASAEKIFYKFSLLFVRSYQCKNEDAGFLNVTNTFVIFLLLDDPKEAYECIHAFQDKFLFFPGTPFKNFFSFHFFQFLDQLVFLLQNGRRKKLRNWDVKVLAAYVKAYSAFFLSSAPFPLNVYSFDTHHSQVIIEEIPERSVIKEFEELCIKIKGKEDEYLLPFRCKVASLMGKYNIYEVLQILDKLHIRFYGISIEEKYTSKIPTYNLPTNLQNTYNDSLVNPFVLILQFVVDGYIKETMDYNDIDDLFNVDLDISHGINVKAKHSSILKPGRLVRRGECLIINQVFSGDAQLYREGTEKDEESLIRTWNMIGCKDNITVARNLTKKQIMAKLEQFRRKLEKTRPDFMVITILSHGCRDKRTGCDFIMDINKEGLSVTSIKNKFINGYSCPSMIGKPKLFFIQACRGKLFQDALSNIPSQLVMPYDFSETDGEEDEEKMLELDGVKYAHKSWFFIFHSTIKGYVSLRDPSGGTIFIQALCKVLNESWYVNDITSIAMEVNRTIMKDYGSAQAPIFENQLGNPVYFEAIKR